MIEGLKVTVSGEELKQLCLGRAQYHQQRAKVYAEQHASMVSSGIEPSQYSGGDPKRAIVDKRAEHENAAREMQFIAEHLKGAEEYQLDNTDLHKLGISHRSYNY